MAAPLNPSDMYMLKGMYDENGGVFKINYPTVPGWEGSGIVVKSGGGWSAWRAMGRRVAFVRKMAGNEMILGGCY